MFQRFLLCVTLLWSINSFAVIQQKNISYEHDGEKLEGILFWDDAKAGKRPGILVLHEWWGRNSYAEKRARMLAEQGYITFAADMYGVGKVTTKPKQAGAWMEEITTDVEFWQERAKLALDILKQQKHVDPTKIAAFGYCFGGGTALQMSYAGADLQAIFSFHGSFPAAPEGSKDNIKPTIHIFHGANDKFVAPEVVTNFEKKLQGANANWQMTIFGGDVRHGFTNPDAGAFGIDNLKYDATADKRSWREALAILRDLFAE
jgi:dienelactone hydrolase